MEHTFEKILFKMNHSTFNQFTALTELYGLTEAEMMNRILHSFAVTSLTITGENKSLYFHSQYGHHVAHVHTTFWEFLIHPDELKTPWKVFEVTLTKKLVDFLKLAWKKSMLFSLSEVFAAAVSFYFKLTRAQLYNPLYVLVTSKWKSKSFEDAPFEIDIVKVLEKRNMRAIFDEQDRCTLVDRIKKNKDQNSERS